MSYCGLSEQVYQAMKGREVSALDIMREFRPVASSREVGDAILDLITARRLWVNECGLLKEKVK